jgi:hypothetical protein
MGHGFSGHRSTAGSKSLIDRQIATGLLVAIDSYLYIKPGKYQWSMR